jgi:hypothetical protein
MLARMALSFTVLDYGQDSLSEPYMLIHQMLITSSLKGMVRTRKNPEVLGPHPSRSSSSLISQSLLYSGLQAVLCSWRSGAQPTRGEP